MSGLVTAPISGAAARKLDLVRSLAKAFRGELVSLHPADEPASKLLERIKAEREAAGAGKSNKKTGRRRKRNT
ncbi:hypothetical protein ACFL59_14440 [Planctomycetota bacterium]